VITDNMRPAVATSGPNSPKTQPTRSSMLQA
jgi:hypothetical protein